VRLACERRILFDVASVSLSIRVLVVPLICPSVLENEGVKHLLCNLTRRIERACHKPHTLQGALRCLNLPVERRIIFDVALVSLDVHVLVVPRNSLILLELWNS
jgi:hypothetical protein